MKRNRRFVILDSDEDDGDGDWLVRDNEDGLGMEHPVVSAYMQSLRRRRLGVAHMYADYLLGLEVPSVQNVVDAKVGACIGAHWDRELLGALRSSSQLMVSHLGHECEGRCGACGLKRRVSCKLSFPGRHWTAGRVCATRAFLANTLMHVQRKSAVARPRHRADTLGAFESLLGMADRVRAYADTTDDAVLVDASQRLISLRRRLGFETEM